MSISINMKSQIGLNLQLLTIIVYEIVADPGCGKIRIRIRDKHPRSATLLAPKHVNQKFLTRK